MSQSSFDAVVFDMDGVIFDSERCVVECWVLLGEKYGIPHMKDTIYACLGTKESVTQAIMEDAYGKAFPYREYKAEVSKRYHEINDGGRLPLKPGVRELLAWLKEQGKGIALASSTRREVVIAQLRDAGILPYFDHVVSGDMVEKSKPEPDIFLKACELLQTEPERTFGIEDSYYGVQSASAGKLRTLMVPDLLPATEQTRAMAEAVLQNLFEVKTYMEKGGQ